MFVLLVFSVRHRPPQPSTLFLDSRLWLSENITSLWDSSLQIPFLNEMTSDGNTWLDGESCQRVSNNSHHVETLPTSLHFCPAVLHFSTPRAVLCPDGGLLRLDYDQQLTKSNALPQSIHPVTNFIISRLIISALLCHHEATSANGGTRRCEGGLLDVYTNTW